MNLLECENVTRIFQPGGFAALKDVSVRLEAGETVGIVGESGSGKSTLANIIGGLDEPTSGSVSYRGRQLSSLSREERKAFRRDVQYIFQDPRASMNPFFSLYRVLDEPLSINRRDLGRQERRSLIERTVTKLGLEKDILTRTAKEVSGGQAQRIAIARCLLLQPGIIIADECVSSLDLSVQAQIINTLRAIRHELGTSFIFISHDIELVRYFCDRIYVMLHGRIVETLDSDKLFTQAQSDYTRLLIGDSYDRT